MRHLIATSRNLIANPSLLSSLVLLFISLLAIQANTAQAKTVPEGDTPTYYVYLAGPEVFLPDPIEAGELKKQAIQMLNEKHQWPFKLVGLYPMDNEIENFAPDVKTGLVIYHANIALMDKAHFVTANMVRFRGPSMDVGTAFEMGYMLGLNKPVFAYYDAKPFYGDVEQPGLYAERVAKYYSVDPENPEKDIHGQSIENFGMEDNLMMIGALQSGHGDIANSFEGAILQIAEHIQARATVESLD